MTKIGHNAPRDEELVEALDEIIELTAPEHRAHFEELRKIAAAGPETIDVPLSREQFEAAVYALRKEAHRQEPASYPHDIAWPDCDPWPSAMSGTADYLEQVLTEAGVRVRGDEAAWHPEPPSGEPA
jgi:hypothetical protein